jgi:hypothetical protein
MRRLVVYFLYLLAGGGIIPGVILAIVALREDEIALFGPAALFLAFGTAAGKAGSWLKKG